MPIEVGAFEAKTQLSKLLELVRKGEKVIITKHGVPVAELVPPGRKPDFALSRVLSEFKEIRKRTKPGPESIKEMIEEGRRH